LIHAETRRAVLYEQEKPACHGNIFQEHNPLDLTAEFCVKYYRSDNHKLSLKHGDIMGYIASQLTGVFFNAWGLRIENVSLLSCLVMA